MATRMPVAMGSDDGTGGGSHCRSASTSNCTTDDSTPYGAASCRALRQGIRDGHYKPQRQQQRQGECSKHMTTPE